MKFRMYLHKINECAFDIGCIALLAAICQFNDYPGINNLFLIGFSALSFSGLSSVLIMLTLVRK